MHIVDDIAVGCGLRVTSEHSDKSGLLFLLLLSEYIGITLNQQSIKSHRVKNKPERVKNK